LSSKQYADNSTVNYTYENTTSRLKSVLDALGQTKQYTYAKDDRISGIVYLNAVNATPNVAFSYDAYFPRITSMIDGNGTTQYGYFAVGSPGALQLQQESRSLPNSTIAYGYDSLARLSSRTAAPSGTETFQYDAVSRLVGHDSDLGSFSLSYLGETAQITQRQLLPVSTNLATNWSYQPNSSDRRLASITNVGLSLGQHSDYQFTTTAENFITGIIESSDAPTVYPSPTTQTASYNDLNQLTNLSGQGLSFDANGNLISDGQRNYSWDAENRLIGITYPGQPGKQTAFAYDGLSRRTAITSTPAGGGSAVTTSYIWCGSRICQARDASNSIAREYYSEGEFVPGSPTQSFYYGIDQVSSIRRVFVNTSSAPAYSYDPYGNALQSTTPFTDFNYAGMFHNADSKLYLTQYRVYDPISGRWLSRDPIGELNGLPGAQVSVAGALGSTLVFTDGFGNVQTAFARIANGVANRTTSAAVDAYRVIRPRDFDVNANAERVGYANPAWAAFTSPTLIQLRDGVGLYPYAYGDPIDFNDPTGQAGFCAWVRAMCVAAWCVYAGEAPKRIRPPLQINPVAPIARSKDE